MGKNGGIRLTERNGVRRKKKTLERQKLEAESQATIKERPWQYIIIDPSSIVNRRPSRQDLIVALIHPEP